MFSSRLVLVSAFVLMTGACGGYSASAPSPVPSPSPSPSPSPTGGPSTSVSIPIGAETLGNRAGWFHCDVDQHRRGRAHIDIRYSNLGLRICRATCTVLRHLPSRGDVPLSLCYSSGHGWNGHRPVAARFCSSRSESRCALECRVAMTTPRAAQSNHRCEGLFRRQKANGQQRGGRA
jgi:hypothetical protein